MKPPANLHDNWHATALELVKRCATELPADVVTALQQAGHDSDELPAACGILKLILDNAKLAAAQGTPLCQDTGTLTFWLETPPQSALHLIRSGIEAAVATATQCGYLRHNTIDSLSGKSIESNVAPGAPLIHFKIDPARTTTAVRLLLKGGGCENVGTQYSLPDVELQAGRDLAGVRTCLLHAIWRAQGLGCAPGILGVAIGGDRASGYHHAKAQLLRPLDDHAPQPELAALESELLTAANSLNIGPMGLGGKATLLGVKVAALARLPACYFVTVAYSCWACRRRGIEVASDGTLRGWLP